MKFLAFASTQRSRLNALALLLLLLSSSLLGACSQQHAPQATASAPPPPAATPATAQQPTVFDTQTQALQKAKDVQKVMDQSGRDTEQQVKDNGG